MQLQSKNAKHAQPAGRSASPQTVPGRPDDLQTQLKGASYAEGAQLLSPVQHKDDSSVDDTLGDAVRLRELQVAFTLPAARALSSSWKHEVRTTRATVVTLAVTRTGLNIGLSPALDLDAQWPVQNMSVWGAGRQFAENSSYANVTLVRGMGEGFLDYTDDVRAMITSLIDRAVAGTAMGKPNYDPFADDKITQTLSAIQANFSALPTAREDDGGAGLEAAEVTRPSLLAALVLNEPFEEMKDGTGIKIPSGGAFSAKVVADGDLASLSRISDPATAAAALKFRELNVSSSDIVIYSKGKPAAQLESLRVLPGGKVEAERFTLLGTGQTAAGVESLFRLLVGTVALANGHPDARSTRTDPELVETAARGKIEAGLTAAVRKLVTTNRKVIPGVDLSQVLGM